MFKEKKLVYKMKNRPGRGEKVPVDSVAPNTAPQRKELMPDSPRENTIKVAYQMIDDVFGKKNRKVVLKAMDPKTFEAVIEDLQSFRGLKYKGTRTEYGHISLVFDRIGENQELKLGFSTVFFTTEEEFHKLMKLTNVKPIDTKALENRADEYIDGHVIEMILNYGPDDMPDDVLDHILKTSLIGNVRKSLVESYKRKKPYLITTSEKGFKLETNDPKDPSLPDKDYDMEKFWRDIKLNDEKKVVKKTPTKETIKSLAARRTVITEDMKNTGFTPENLDSNLGALQEILDSLIQSEKTGSVLAGINESMKSKWAKIIDIASGLDAKDLDDDSVILKIYNEADLSDELITLSKLDENLKPGTEKIKRIKLFRDTIGNMFGVIGASYGVDLD